MSTHILHFIAIGSINPVKIAACKTAIARCWPAATFIAVESGSSVSDQPWGDAETRRGAVNRARDALAQVPDAGFGVGLEGGLVETEFGVMSCAWCAVVARDGRLGIGGSVNFMLPEAVAERVRAGEELGPAMDALTGISDSKQKMGAVGILTDGMLDREAAYAQIVKLAMARFVSEYFDG
ncbi:MAG: inosine/xanthosine triphosphatase [Chloroflexota bacterium]